MKSNGTMGAIMSSSNLLIASDGSDGSACALSLGLR